MSKRKRLGDLKESEIYSLPTEIWEGLVSHIPDSKKNGVIFCLLGTCRASVQWLMPLINKEIRATLETLDVWSCLDSPTKRSFLTACLEGNNKKLKNAWCYSLAMSIINLVKLEKESLPYVRDMSMVDRRCKNFFQEIKMGDVYYRDPITREILPVMELVLMKREYMIDSDGQLCMYYGGNIDTDKAIQIIKEDTALIRPFIFNTLKEKPETSEVDVGTPWYKGVYDGEHVLGHSRLEFRSNCYIYRGPPKEELEKRRVIWLYVNSKKHVDEVAAAIHKYSL